MPLMWRGYQLPYGKIHDAAMNTYTVDRSSEKRQEHQIIHRMLNEALPEYEHEVMSIELRLASLRIIRNSIRLALKTDYAQVDGERLQ